MKYEIVKKKIKVTVPNSRPEVTLDNMLEPLQDRVINVEFPVKVYPMVRRRERNTYKRKEHWIVQKKNGKPI